MKRATRKDLEERLMRAENQVVVLQHRDEQQTKLIDEFAREGRAARSLNITLNDKAQKAESAVSRLTEELRKTEQELQEARAQRMTSDETASAYLKAFKDASELAAERGKINSVLVRRINELEQER